LARLCLVKERMVILLLPSVAAIATGHIFAAILVICNEGAWLPVGANRFAVISEQIRLSSEVLPIVRIYALSLVVVLVEWTVLSFEVVHVEICILLHLVNKPGFELLSAVGE